jgi:hypothetical protein
MGCDDELIDFINHEKVEKQIELIIKHFLIKRARRRCPRNDRCSHHQKVYHPRVGVCVWVGLLTIHRGNYCHVTQLIPRSSFTSFEASLGGQSM